MKKLFSVIVLTLALNFLALAGGVGYLRATGRLDRAKVMAVKDVLFPPPATQPSEAVESGHDEATTQPMLRLEELLAQQTGRSASEQVDFLQHTFDTQMAQLDRRQRELSDLQKQIELARAQLKRDRGEVDDQRKALETREQDQARLASDQGFQDSLALYKSMSSKQLKGVFMGMDHATVAKYLQAMEPRTASKIVKEFKAPQEDEFIQKVLEKLRQPAAEVAAPTTQPTARNE